MAHFAQINVNVVTEVIVIANADCDDLPFPESEPVGQTYITALGIEGTWLQCSYNANFRGCYPGPAYTFNPALGEYGEFVAPPSIEE